MTEIPEHLLKRSKAAKGQSSGDAGSESSGSAAPAASEGSAAPVAAGGSAPAAAAPQGPVVTFPNLDSEPEPPKPEPAFVTAAKSRRRIPVWALPVVAALPIWAMSFAGTMQQPETEDPVLVESAAIYSEAGCAGCHGGNGGGGSGYQLSEGSVITTFPRVADQMLHVARGSAAIDGQTYGADGRRVAGASGAQMPAQAGSLTVHELELVIYHERATLSGEDQDQPGYQEWIEHMRADAESGGGEEIVNDDYIAFLQECADPAVSPDATGAMASPDPEAEPCPGPKAESGG